MSVFDIVVYKKKFDLLKIAWKDMLLVVTFTNFWSTAYIYLEN